MNTPHKHAAVIRAWADGAEIESRLDSNSPWYKIDLTPQWHEDREYRVKSKHQAVKDAYEKGAVIQVRPPQSDQYCTSWKTLDSRYEAPAWNEDFEYRVHPHNELMKAHGEGAVIQYQEFNGGWVDTYNNDPSWGEETKYRIKPEQKPNTHLMAAILFEESVTHRPKFVASWTGQDERLAHIKANVKFTFDGETNELIGAEVIK